MANNLKLARQHQELERVKLLSHLFDPDPEHPERIADSAKKLPLPPGLRSRAAAAEEFTSFLRSEFGEVRRLAASALGKMALEGDYHSGVFLPILADLVRNDERPQVRQYAAKSIGRYGEKSVFVLDALKDVAREEGAPSYLRNAAADAVAAIQSANRARLARRKNWCTRCKRPITDEEYMAGMERWGRPYCRHCLDERELENVNFEFVVEDAKKRRTGGGVSVQSIGEKRIAEFLESEGIAFMYDERYRIAGDAVVRPDFYLPEFDVYIEYFGMNTPEYIRNKERKKFLYQRAGKKLISISYKDDERLIEVLREKLSRYFRLKGDTSASNPDPSQP
jgi:hypothetical protein